MVSLRAATTNIHKVAFVMLVVSIVLSTHRSQARTAVPAIIIVSANQVKCKATETF